LLSLEVKHIHTSVEAQLTGKTRLWNAFSCVNTGILLLKFLVHCISSEVSQLLLGPIFAGNQYPQWIQPARWDHLLPWITGK